VIISLCISGFICTITGQISGPDSSQVSASKLNYWAYDLLDLPDLRGDLPGRPIIIAVVDDAFRLSHKDIKDFVYQNPGETRNNHIDDDGNGKRDDSRGWDISDNDNDVSPPAGRGNEYFHGTFICGSIITILERCYGKNASRYFKILPVKVLSDHADIPFLQNGYMGIEYAIGQNPDIICCAWSGGEPTGTHRDIIETAHNKGIAIIGSAGNYYSERVDAPSNLEGVLSVAGIDTILRKTNESNFGSRVDMVAPAVKVRGSYPLADNAYFYGGGTSGATALVTGCVAVLKSVNPGASPQELYDALINTSVPVDDQNLSYCGKLGAGFPDLSEAIDYLRDPENRNTHFNPVRPEGKLSINSKLSNGSWDIAPAGAYDGFNFRIISHGKSSLNQSLSFYAGDSLWIKASIGELPPELFVPGDKIHVEYKRTRRWIRNPVEVGYSALTIDSTRLYCGDIQYYTIPEGEITDGSFANDYANGCSCKWQIIAPEGKRITFEFVEFDTQPNTDFVYLFDGESTIPGNIIAKFSGTHTPPEVTSRTNKALIWFVTDSTVTGEGWKLFYRIVD